MIKLLPEVSVTANCCVQRTKANVDTLEKQNKVTEELRDAHPPLTPRLLAWLDQHKMSSYEEQLRGFGVQSVVRHATSAPVAS